MHSTCTGTGTWRLRTGAGTGTWRLGTGTWITGTGTGTGIGTCLLSTWYKTDSFIVHISNK